MTTTTIALILALITLPIVILLWATESQDQRIIRRVKNAHRKGHSQRRIAAELGLTRYRVRACLAA